MREHKVILITGASSGIGHSLSYQFAKGGCDDLVVNARREEHLVNLKKDIESRYDCNVHVIPMDLSDPDAPDRLY